MTKDTEVELLRKGVYALEKKCTLVGMSSKAFLKEASFAMQIINNNPTVGKCSKDSILAAVYNVALTGLTLNPVFGYAYLVPRGGKCVLDISYKGFVYVAKLNGGITDVKANCIYEGDQFEAEEGSNPTIYHKPDYFGKRDKILGVYCVATLADGTKKHEIMNEAEVEKCRAVSAMKSGEIWKKWTDEMRKKTVIRRARKLWPHCEKSAIAAEIQNETDGFEPIERQLKPTVEMPKALPNYSEKSKPGEVVDCGQPEDFTEPKHLDDIPEPPIPQQEDDTVGLNEREKLFIEIAEWREKIGEDAFFNQVLVNFNKEMVFPKSYTDIDLETVIKISKVVDKKCKKGKNK